MNIQRTIRERFGVHNVTSLKIESIQNLETVSTSSLSKGFTSRFLCAVSRLEGNTWDGYLVAGPKPWVKKIEDEEIDFNNVHARSLGVGLSEACAFGVNTNATEMGVCHSHVLTAQDDGIVGVFTADTLDSVAQIRAHDDMVLSLSLANGKKDCEYFWSAAGDGSLKYWSIEHSIQAEPGSALNTYYNAHFGSIVDTSITNTYDSVFTVGRDGHLRKFSANQRGPTEDLCLGQIGASVCCVPDSHFIIVGLEDGAVRILDDRKMTSDSLVCYDVGFHLNRRVRRIRPACGHKNLVFLCCEDNFLYPFYLNNHYDLEVDFDNTTNPFATVGIGRGQHTDFVTDCLIVDSGIITVSYDGTVQVSEHFDEKKESGLELELGLGKVQTDDKVDKGTKRKRFTN
jgi:WD40 repeat protein